MSKRILIGGFKHETNTFSILPTDLDAYSSRCLYRGEEVFRVFQGTNSEIAGFLDTCTEQGWTPVPSIVGDASPSGAVTQEAYDEITTALLQDANTGEGVDAVLLQLHGAMATEHLSDGEGELLRLMRDVIGPDVPIGITLDLHANVTEDMARYADVIVSYRTYPHVDQREVARECAGLIAKTLNGEIRPICYVRRPPQLTGLDQGRTTAPGPMREALLQAAALTDSPDIYAVSVLAGFAKADIPDAGPSVVVVSDQANSSAVRQADQLIAHIWQTRDVRTIDLRSTEEAIALARSLGRPGRPVVIADFADNPGGGGYGDSTRLLRSLIESDLQDVGYGALYDPESAELCHQAGAGGAVALSLGGKVDPQFGPPVTVMVDVLKLTDGKFVLEGPMQAGVPVDMGPSALIEVNGVKIVLASRRYQNYDRMFFASFGVDLQQFAVIAVKSAQHFRAAYGDRAAAIAVVDDGDGITTEDVRTRVYRNLRRPIFPIDL